MTPFPHSPEAEQSVLGSILINPDAYYDCAAFLTATDFYIHRHGYVWSAFERLNETRTPIDITTVSTELERMGKLAEIGGAAYLTQLCSNVNMFDSNNAEHYARSVEGHSIRRRMIAAASETAKLAYDTELEADEALSQAHAVLQDITPSNRNNRLSLADRILEAVTIAGDKMGEVTGITTGLKSLNVMLDGFKGDDLVFIAARPGMGKTGLLITSARAALSVGKSVAFFSMEMGDVSVGQRLIAQQFGVDLFDMRRGRMKPDEYSSFADGLEWLRDLEDSRRLQIIETVGLTAQQIHAETKRLAVRGLCDIAFVDYVQLMSGRGENRTQEVGDCSRGLKRMALDLHIPVISAAQLSREIEKRSSAKPTLADLRESGSLEQDADVVIFIWQQGEKVERAAIDPANITVSKHRNGPVGDLVRAGMPTVQFVRKSTKFEDV
jgi:replicative DNA helicase